MNNIASNFGFFNSSISIVFLILSLIIAVILLVVGLILKIRVKGKSKSAWICIGLGSISIITNALQLFIRFQ